MISSPVPQSPMLPSSLSIFASYASKMLPNFLFFAAEYLICCKQFSVLLGILRVVNLPGCTAVIGDMIDTLRRIAGDRVADLIEVKPDPRIEPLVRSWPARFTNEWAHRLGFFADPDVESIIREIGRAHV